MGESTIAAMEDSHSDVVVIGAGVGGLATAMRLAHAGLRVTVLEAHDAPGGKMRTVPSPAGPVDAGPTVLTMRPVFEALFADAGTRLEDHVTLVREPCLARHWWPDGTCLDLYDDPDRSTEEIRATLGEPSAREFHRFSTRARALFDAFDAPLMQAADPSPMSIAMNMRPGLLAAMGPLRTMARQLAREFSEPKLRQLFGRYATYVGGSPYESPAVLRLVADAEARGVWRVKGGMTRLARAMADVAEARGTQIRYGKAAERIEVQSGRIVAVHLSGGGRVPAARVVFNGDPRALSQGLLGPAAEGAVPVRAVEPRSLSANVWAFAARPRGAELRASQRLFWRRSPDRVRSDPRRISPRRSNPLCLRPGSWERPHAARDRAFRDHHERPAPPGRPAGGHRLMSDTHLPGPRPEGLAVFPRAPRFGADDTSGVRRALSGEPRLPLRPEPAWADGSLRPAQGSDIPLGALSGGRRSPSGGGSADGSPLRRARGRGDSDGPNFHIAVPPNGYAWWYVDGISDCGTRAVSVIAFIGSVFSPWYRWSGRRDPENHVCINVATYGPGGRFTMTDRGRSALRTSPDVFEVGPSKLTWRNGRLEIDIDEISSLPLVSRVRGRITVTPTALTDVEVPLLPDGSHIWRPFAPSASIEVDLNRGWQWTGHGYFDSNFGTAALEDDFRYWTWGRFPVADGATCFYDAERRDGSHLELGVHFGADGSASVIDPPPRTRVARSLWAVRRETRADPGFQPHQTLSMLDAPFYTRSVVETQIGGEVTQGVHEALDLDRFASPLLKPMLAVRVPRRPGWRFAD